MLLVKNINCPRYGKMIAFCCEHLTINEMEDYIKKYPKGEVVCIPIPCRYLKNGHCTFKEV